MTHVVYAALHEVASLVKGWNAADQIRTNTQMLANLLDARLGFQHLTLLQGTKAYGVHHGL